MPRGIYKNIICDKGKHPEFFPQEHQKELLEYFIDKLSYKGLLVYHRLGSGKSCSSILISDAMLKLAKTKKIFVLTPGSLRQNFIEEYCDKCGYKPKYLKKYYTFVTTNYSVGDNLPDFNNNVVIIDEVHNLINGVKNLSKHSTIIYKTLMKSDCKILALTGTVITNYIWEWPLLGNLLKPGTFTNIIKNKQIDEEAFMLKFVINSNGDIRPKNPNAFKVKLRGIISYFPGISNKFYPTVIYEEPIKIRMTPEQDTKYWNVAEWERSVRAKGAPPRSLLLKDKKQYDEKLEEFIMSSKYIMSRLFSNFYYPEEIRNSTLYSSRDEIQHIGKVLKYIYKPTGKTSYSKPKLIKQIKEENGMSFKKINSDITKDYEMKNIGWITNEKFKDNKLMDFYSRKMAVIIINIVSNWRSKHVVFSFFKTKSGVNMLYSLFKMCGIKTEIYSGDISDSKRKRILYDFNEEKNRYGDYIKVLLVTEAGAEGINILEAQHMHILESSPREMKIQQAIGRVVRYRSHSVVGRKPMPKNEQVVHIWRYWSISTNEPVKIKRNKKDSSEENEITITDKTTVDEILYRKGRTTFNTIQNFLQLLKNESVTSYDKAKDSTSLLKLYGNPLSPILQDAYDKSDKRYKDNIYPNIVKEIGDVSDDEDLDE